VKIFSNIQELWDYCLLCPICQENCRDMKVSVGPDMVFLMNSYEKTETMLNLCCNYKNSSYTYTVNYKINCIDNTFIMTVPLAKPNNETYRKASRAYFFFYIQSACKNCDCSVVYGNDLELNVLTKKITDIKLDREDFYLYKEIDKFYLAIIHNDNIMLVSRHTSKYQQPYEKQIKLPLFDIDLIDQAKTIEKLKTYILFS
jgi:hypothetical protein